MPNVFLPEVFKNRAELAATGFKKKLLPEMILANKNVSEE
jgi:hypothetical protein